MSDAAELRFFTEVCRALAEGSRDAGEKASWLRLALKWERMEAACVGFSSGAGGRASSPIHAPTCYAFC
jgi:hypothetical protein